MREIELGDKVECKITGFVGVVTSISQFINGCTQCGVTPKCGKDNQLKESIDFDIEQLKVIGRKKKIKKKDTGGPQIMRTKRSAY